MAQHIAAQQGSLAARVQLPRLTHPPVSGVQLVKVETSTLPGEVEPDDLLCIDFDQHRVARDGLYVVQLGSWTGIRRFVDTFDGLRVLDGDRWRPVGRTLRILGYVAEVYAPRRPVGAMRHRRADSEGPAA